MRDLQNNMLSIENIKKQVILWALIISSFYLSFYFKVEKIYTSNEINSDTVAYLKLKDKMRFSHDSIFTLYCSGNKKQESQYLKNTEQFLLETYYKTLIPKWLGTKWAFYGETQIPGDSSIACGHFVVTTLKHLGFQMENSHEMATNYSAYMVNSLCDTSFKVSKANELLKIVEKYPDDVWVVGLRSHSGLLVKYKGQLRFVHSCAGGLSMVIDESAEESITFQGSNIFVSGPLFKNNSLTKKWLQNEEVKYIKKY